MWLKLIEYSFPFARPLGIKLRCCVRRSGVLAAALLCVRRSNGVVQAPRVLPGRVHVCMQPTFDFLYAMHYILIKF